MTYDYCSFSTECVEAIFSLEEIGRLDLKGKMATAYFDYLIKGIEPEDSEIIPLWRRVKRDLEPARQKIAQKQRARINGAKRATKKATAPEDSTAPQTTPEEVDGQTSGKKRGRGRPPKKDTAHADPERATAPLGTPATSTADPGTIEPTPTATNAPAPPDTSAPQHPGNPSTPPPPPPFIAPTLEEVKEYAREMGAEFVNAEKFFYNCRKFNWRDGRGNFIDWKNALMEWNAVDKNDPKKRKTATDRPTQPKQPRPSTREPEHGHKDEEPERKAMKPDDFIRSKGYEPEDWRGNYPGFLAMLREKEKPTTTNPLKPA